MKPRVFIGSSREAVSLAKVISEALADTCFCEVWCDHFFDVNASSFDMLCKKAILFDFAILLGAGDDLSLIRNHLHQTIRDNVLFEYGLFTGALGRQRTFILLHTKSKIPSDLYGVTTLSFRNEEELRQQCRLLLRTIEQEYSVCRISMLPSTASAIAYFENFISPLCQALLSNSRYIRIPKRSILTLRRARSELWCRKRSNRISNRRRRCTDYRTNSSPARFKRLIGR